MTSPRWEPTGAVHNKIGEAIVANIGKRSFVVALVLATFIGGSLTLSAEPSKTEDQLIEMLKSRDHRNVSDALDRLPNWYPDSTKAMPVIKELLKSNDVVGIDSWGKPLPFNILARRAAR